MVPIDLQLRSSSSSRLGRDYIRNGGITCTGGTLRALTVGGLALNFSSVLLSDFFRFLHGLWVEYS